MTQANDEAPSGRATDQGSAAPSSEIRTMFDGIARVYDPMNLVISAFQEPRWRRRAVAARTPPRTPAITSLHWGWRRRSRLRS